MEENANGMIFPKYICAEKHCLLAACVRCLTPKAEPCLGQVAGVEADVGEQPSVQNNDTQDTPLAIDIQPCFIKYTIGDT